MMRNAQFTPKQRACYNAPEAALRAYGCPSRSSAWSMDCKAAQAALEGRSMSARRAMLSCIESLRPPVEPR